MKKMKLMAMALCMGLMLCACGNDNTAADSKNQETTVESSADKTEAASENSADKAEDKKDAEETKTETEDKKDDKTEVTDNSTDTAESKAEVSVRDIYTEITKNVELVSPMEPPADFIGNIIYGFNVNELPEYVFSMPEMAESAELVFIAKTNGADQADTVKNSLESYKNEQAEMMKDYIPAEYDIIAAGNVVIKGDYVYLVISHNSDAIIEIIEKNIQ